MDVVLDKNQRVNADVHLAGAKEQVERSLRGEIRSPVVRSFFDEPTFTATLRGARSRDQESGDHRQRHGFRPGVRPDVVRERRADHRLCRGRGADDRVDARDPRPRRPPVRRALSPGKAGRPARDRREIVTVQERLREDLQRGHRSSPATARSSTGCSTTATGFDDRRHPADRAARARPHAGRHGLRHRRRCVRRRHACSCPTTARRAPTSPAATRASCIRSVRRLMQLPDADARLPLPRLQGAEPRRVRVGDDGAGAERTANVHVHEGVTEDEFVEMRKASATRRSACRG